MSDTTPASRRNVLMAAGGLAAALGLPQAALAAGGEMAGASAPNRPLKTIVTADGTKIFYKDWGAGRPIVFSHGWPLSADAWDAQMLFLGTNGYRVIAHDRRSHGRSEQTWSGNDMDTYADDLASVLNALDLKDAMLVGHSTGGGEVARYIGRHGTGRVSKAVLIGSVTPQMLKTPENPGGLPIGVFDGIRAGVVADRAEFYRTLTMPFYNYNKPGAKVSQGVIDAFVMQGLEGGIKGQYDCIKQFSETDFTGDLKKMTVPTLVLHGDGDQIVPIADSALRAVKILPKATLKVYPGLPHGMCTTHAATINADLLAFARS
ncbi:MAG: alpha/beta hydrolase [Vulcanimicrobiaceae bacterium]